MKMKNFLWIGLAAVMSVAISLAWMACQQVPNADEKVSLHLNLNTPQAPGGAAAAGDVQAQSGFTGYEYDVKITLTKPDETFYVYDYIPGVPVSLSVASGNGRALNVELYEVDGTTVYQNYVPAYHYVISQPITLDLKGDPVSVTVDVVPDLNTTYLASQLPHRLVDPVYGNTVLSSSCPAPNYSAYVNDAFFGLTFPSLDVANPGLFDGSIPPNQTPLIIDNLLQDRLYYIEVYHKTAGFYDDMAIFTGNTTSFSVPPLLFQHFNSNRSVFFSPSQVTGVAVGDSVQVSFGIQGGYGTLVPYTAYTDYNYDSCGGYEVSAGVWKTYPYRTICVTNIWAEDCDGTYAQGSMEISTALTPTCVVDGYCDDYAGEDNNSCRDDCYCGDGLCFPPYEDYDKCNQDCGGG